MSTTVPTRVTAPVASAPAASREHPAQPGPVLRRARATTREKATTFALACRMLPSGLRDDVYLLYLVLRTLDDLVDEHHDDAVQRVAAVEAWASGQAACGTPETEVLDALTERHPIPRQAIADFCAGMRQDLARARFATEDDLDLYCYRVAGTVGVLMAALLGVENEAGALPAAAALGMAMQRTNILRDIDEDLDAGRIFLAQETVRRFGSLAPGDRAALVRDQIARADALYERGLSGIGQLRRGRRAIAAAGTMYREILREIERRGCEAPGRAVVSPRRKLGVGIPAAIRA
jgi:phytoene synthase